MGVERRRGRTTRRIRIAALSLAAALAVVAGCNDSTAGPGSSGGSRLSLVYGDSGTFEASGAPTFQGGSLAASTFATAFADSVGGFVLSSFQQTQGSTGDLFVLQLTDRRTGAFGPCGPGRECHGRILEALDAATFQIGGTYWEITSGSVQVDQAGPDRLAGSFSDLTLEAQDSSAAVRTIPSGTFDLELLSDAGATAAVRCFLATASGAGGC